MKFYQLLDGYLSFALAALALFAAPPQVAHAVPANPAFFTIVQPNGNKITAIIRGDEYQGWIETADGYTILRSDEKGTFQYAIERGGRLVPSGQPALPDFEAAKLEIKVPKGLRPPRNVELQRAQTDWIRYLREVRAPFRPAAVPGEKKPPPAITGTWAPREVKGRKNLIVILVGFKDARLTGDALAYWSKAVFEPKAPSVATFYRDNSYGKVSIAPVAHSQQGSPPGVVAIELPENHPNRPNTRFEADYGIESAWVTRALAEAAKYVDFAKLDANHDGYIHVDEALVYFVLAGYEAASSHLEPAIWAHRWGLKGREVPVAGKKIDNWAVNGEMFDDRTRLGIGTVAHEMGHAMGGLPDLYDVDKRNQGLGIFSVMAQGSWGNRHGEPRGTTPVGMDAWSRQYLGWSTPRYPDKAASLDFGSGLANSSSAVLLMNPSITTSEYWIVENRHPVGWDEGMSDWLGGWSGGLLIQHIDANVGNQDDNSFNSSSGKPHQGNTAVEPASAQCHLLKNPTTPGCPTVLFYDGNASAFDGNSKPGTTFYSGKASSLAITKVSRPGSKMTAEVQIAP